MLKTTLLFHLFVLSMFFSLAQVAKQSFDKSTDDNWGYTSNISFYSQNNGADLWKEWAGANGRIPSAFSGSTYLAGRDLDNEYSQTITGLASPEHMLTFDTFNLNGLGAEISFRVHYVGINKGDYMYYELMYDNGTNWPANPDHKADIFKTAQNGNFNSRGWEEITFNVPSGNSHVRMRLVVYQNGNEYLGFDSFEIKTATLSTNNNVIDGFSFGPNPTTDIIKLKANVILDHVVFYNVLGKELIATKIKDKDIEINLSSLPSGIYIAKVLSGDITQSFKVIKK